ncbi:unnamed protein product [Didymodactylos carnosus]|uniref:Acetyl-coenzyme A transporter 1 n=1 Tax=Didymodactylos carnosus TaxID=1234261 RepID=A0A814UVZ7_9BILA|nr:unnamed protein product [Didymodactylos carnosus]CAF3944732.1 unnamed protein product [Didymodactylos carnosus]
MTDFRHRMNDKSKDHLLLKSVPVNYQSSFHQESDSASHEKNPQQHPYQQLPQDEIMLKRYRPKSSSIDMNLPYKQNWRSDRSSIFLLLFLYLLQGIPLGMAASIPLIIQTFGASWSQQAIFSFAFWPFSLKLIWAPIVDSLYLKRFGRRKTWLIPVQYLIGITMLVLSYSITNLLTAAKTAHPRTENFFFRVIYTWLNRARRVDSENMRFNV